MSTPEVEAVLEAGGRTVRVRCPFCSTSRRGTWHVHGLGAAGDSYGVRLSHCRTGRRPYRLVPAEAAA
jgi:hypothetical protein